MTALKFDGIAFDPTGVGRGNAATDVRSGGTEDASATVPGPAAGHESRVGQARRTDRGDRWRSGRVAAEPVAEIREGGASAANPIAEIRAGVVAAHRAALSAQVALQWALWRRAGQPERPDANGVPRTVAMPPASANSGREHVEMTDARNGAHLPAAGEPSDVGARGRRGDSGTANGGRRVAAPEGAFKPLARSGRTRLDRAALQALARGEVAEVFGASYRRPGVESVSRLAGHGPLVLTEVTAIELYGGAGNGRVVARFEGDTAAAATQAGELFALYSGMPLCLSGSTLSTGVVGTPVVASGTVELVVEALDLVPRPFVRARAEFRDAAALEVTVMVVEAAGADVGPGGAVRGPLLNEFHMAHLARGDQGIAMGPEFDAYTGVRATRLPTGGLLLVDRVLTFDGARGQLDSASYTTEYDSPADSWYYADTANESMPHFVYMETSLQAALLMGYYAGPTLTQPGTTLSLRNLGGTATVLRQVDLRDRTIVQSSRLLSTTILPGSSLQTFDYTLSVDGAPFYRGETMFGYFSDEALANQTGLDAGRFAPTWLARHPEARTRVIDVAARRADPAARLCARRTLALIDRVEVVDGGGEHGAGYLRSLREIDPSDWFFARHFHLDPVIPGSLGVESVIHAVQEWMIDTGFASDMADPAFRIPADIAFGWRYRGQFLPTDGTVELEAHIKSVRREPGRVTVTVDGSLWKPGLRIYELVDLAIELVDGKARP